MIFVVGNLHLAETRKFAHGLQWTEVQSELCYLRMLAGCQNQLATKNEMKGFVTKSSSTRSSELQLQSD
jgi:hypothetical protein